MRRLILLALAAALLSACVAETIERRRPRKGPVKEVGFVDYGGGRVRFSSEGWPWIVASRRRTAQRLMARNCGRDLEPRVTDEYTRQDADAVYAGEDVTASLAHGDEHFVVEKYVHLTYECRPPGWVEPAPSTGPARAPLLVIPAAPSSTEAATVPLSTAPAAVPLSSSTAPSPEAPKP